MNFVTRGEARAMREAQEQAQKEPQTNRVTDLLNDVLMGLSVGNLGLDSIKLFHTDADGNAVLDKEIKAIK